METAKEHNRKRLAEITRENGPQGVGLACDKCGDELVFSDPPQRNVHCLKCGYKTTIY